MSEQRPQSLTEEAYYRLRADLLACRLPPGTRLKINDLGEELGSSLGVVREALTRLAAEGLVVSEAQRGFRVPEIAVEDLKHLSDARIEIECLCLRRSVVEGDVDWEARLLGAYHRMTRVPERDPQDPSRLADPYVELHAAFHAELVEGCRNVRLKKIRNMLFIQSERYRRLSVPLQKPRRDLDTEHRSMMEATLARDADKACEIIRHHLLETTRILIDSGVCDEGAGKVVRIRPVRHSTP